MSLYTTLISPLELLEHLSDPAWAIFDCRFDLKDLTWGERVYQQGHIPGAVYADLDKHLSGRKSKFTGRHPLPAIEIISAQLSSWGITDSTQVVVYDQLGGAYAARLWWTLRFLGHKAAAVLDGGIPAWQQADYPLETGDITRTPAVFHPSPKWDMLVSTSEVASMINSPTACLIDARAPERFRGEVEPIDSVAGHIPSAVNRFHGENLTTNGEFLPSETLRSAFTEILAGTAPEQAVVYCGSGVTSCHHLLAMQHAGLPMAHLYLGSWSEWITDRTRPVVTEKST